MPLRVLKKIAHLSKWVQAMFIIIADQLDRTLHPFTDTPKLHANLGALSTALPVDEENYMVDTLISNLLIQGSSGQPANLNIRLDVLEQMSMDAACNHSTLS